MAPQTDVGNWESEEGWWGYLEAGRERGTIERALLLEARQLARRAVVGVHGGHAAHRSWPAGLAGLCFPRCGISRKVQGPVGVSLELRGSAAFIPGRKRGALQLQLHLRSKHVTRPARTHAFDARWEYPPRPSRGLPAVRSLEMRQHLSVHLRPNGDEDMHNKVSFLLKLPSRILLS
jgi:hypothetical protein